MNPTLLRAVVLLVPVLLLVVWSALLTARTPVRGAVLQLAGAACLLVVVLTHIAEGLRVMTAMRWGEGHSVGHYVDISSAIVGAILVSLGFIMRVRARPR